MSKHIKVIYKAEWEQVVPMENYPNMTPEQAVEWEQDPAEIGCHVESFTGALMDGLGKFEVAAEVVDKE